MIPLLFCHQAMVWFAGTYFVWVRLLVVSPVCFLEKESTCFQPARFLNRCDLCPAVSFEGCTGQPRTLYVSDDTRIKVGTDGVLAVKRSLRLHNPEMSFLVHAWDSARRKLSTKVTLKAATHNNRRRHHHHHVCWSVSWKKLTYYFSLLPKPGCSARHRSDLGLGDCLSWGCPVHCALQWHPWS